MGIFATFAVSFGDVSLSGDALKREPGETPGQTRCEENVHRLNNKKKSLYAVRSMLVVIMRSFPGTVE